MVAGVTGGGVVEVATNTTSNLVQLVPEQYTTLVQSVTGLLQVIIGGMFGLIVISILFKLWEDVRMGRLMKQLNDNIADLNRHLRKHDAMMHTHKRKNKR